MVLAEGLVLQRDKGILRMLRNLADLDDGPVLIAEGRIDDVAFVIVKHRALGEQAVNIVGLNIGSLGDDHAYIYDTGQHRGQNGADDSDDDLLSPGFGTHFFDRLRIAGRDSVLQRFFLFSGSSPFGGLFASAVLFAS